MALHHVLFRCPACGHDPLEGEGDRAWCVDCKRQYSRRRAGSTIHVEGNGSSSDSPIAELMQQIEEHGGALTAARGPDGLIRYEARVTAKAAAVDEPVRFRGQVLGFVEQLGEGKPGLLSIDEEAIRFLPDGASTEQQSWTLLGVRAVQSASSSIQISPSEGGVVVFRFESDSPVRWESLVKSAMQDAYSRAGRGTIQEFQPRIVSG